MNINKLLRRLTPPQIIAAAAVALLAGLALIIFGVGPLVTTLLLPLGEATAAVAGLVAYFGLGWVVGHYIGKIAGRAYYDRKTDDEMHRITLEYAEARARGGSF